MGTSRVFDQIAIGLSAVCVVHCLAVPVLVTALPVLAVSFGGDAHFHGLMLWLVVPTSVIGFSLGFRVHGKAGIVGLGTAGVVTLAVAALWGHNVWTVSSEIAVSVVGSAMLGSAHWLNFREVRRRRLHP